MGTLTYTTLANLVAGNPENVADVVDCLQKIQAILNGSVDYVNLAAVVNSDYRTLHERNGALIGGRPTATRPFVGDLSNNQGLPTNGAGLNAAKAAFYLDPARYPFGARALKLNVAGVAYTNAVAPTGNYTFGLYAVTPAGGASGFVDLTIGSQVSGSSAAVSAPVLSSFSHAESADFDFPSAGYYALCMTNSATVAASATVDLTVRLDIHAV